MVDHGDSRPSPLKWDPIQKIYIEVRSMQRARELDELNEQIENLINDENEYEMSSNNQINEYDNDVSMIQAPLIWDPRNNKYIEVNNLRDAVKTNELNEIVENYEKEENKYYEYYQGARELSEGKYRRSLKERKIQCAFRYIALGFTM